MSNTTGYAFVGDEHPTQVLEIFHEYLIHTTRDIAVDIICYHSPCIDGFTAAYLAYKNSHEAGNYPLLYPIGYEEGRITDFVAWVEKIQLLCSNHYTYDVDIYSIMSVDFGLPFYYIDHLLDVAQVAKIVVCDHHKTAYEKYFPENDIEILPAVVWHSNDHRVSIIFNNNKSGASIVWYYLNGVAATYLATLPELVKYVEDSDLWMFQYEETRAVNMYLKSMEMTLDNWQQVFLALDSPTANIRNTIIARGYSLLDSIEKIVNAYASSGFDIELNGITGLAACCHGEYASDVGNKLVEKSGTFGMTYYTDDLQEVMKCSLRSDPVADVDVAEIAKLYGGGGHKYAAGFSMEMDEFVNNLLPAKS